MYVIIEKNEVMLLPICIKRDKKIIISTRYYECTDLFKWSKFVQLFNYALKVLKKEK